MRSLLLPLSCVLALTTLARAVAPARPDAGLLPALKRQQGPAPGLLSTFQVYEPVLTPTGPSDRYGCVYTSTLMEHDFALSYGRPFVGDYAPPSCGFNRVTMNLTVTSRGRQFDRLAIMYLGDVEVFRTSTAEPTKKGIVWTYVKEMQQYDALWRAEQKIIFDLGNLIDGTYTGIYNATLTATFFTVPDSPATADSILPISARRSAANGASVFTLPGDNATVAYTLPKNVKRAVVSLAACGQGAEEFWYTNTLTSDEDTFANTTGALYGGSPFREVQLLIDGQLGGVAWPFPIIFTGGIVPGFWRPVVGIDAFDLREYEIDVTPWLPVLLDGAPHTFEIKVASLADDGAGHAALVDATGPFWLVTGKIFLFLDEPGSVTVGSTPVVDAPAPAFGVSSAFTQNATGANETLTYTTTASRSFSVSSTIRTSSGTRLVSWTQSLSFTNLNALTAQGLTQSTTQSTTGTDASAPATGYSRAYSYPLAVDSSYYASPDGHTLSINGSLTRGLHLLTLGNGVFPSGIQNFDTVSSSSSSSSSPVIISLPGAATLQSPGQVRPDGRPLPAFAGARLDTTQAGTAGYYSGPNASYGFGSTGQELQFGGVQAAAAPGGGGRGDTELYWRRVQAVNGSVVRDEQRLAGTAFGVPPPGASDGDGVGGREQEEAAAGRDGGPRAFLGRGPGEGRAAA